VAQGAKMRTVNIAELKNRLSAYLNQVKDGEEIVVRDRNVPVARIVPLRSEDYDADRLKLAAEGRLRLGTGEPLGESFWNLPAPRISMRHIIRAIDEDRNED
jgi:prevent-host-death family protein